MTTSYLRILPALEDTGFRVGAGEMALNELAAHIEHFRRRVLQDALAEATHMYWMRRAEAFEAAIPRPTDFTGDATPERLEGARRRLAATARACRSRAVLSLPTRDRSCDCADHNPPSGTDT